MHGKGSRALRLGPGVLSLGRYALGLAAIAVVFGSLGLAAVIIRRRLLAPWRGAPARLAESVIGLALVIGMLEVLGTIGWFRLGPIVIASALAAGAAWRWRGVSPGAGTLPSPPVSPAAQAVAIAVVATLFTEWTVPTLHAYDIGIRASDSLWYHLPWAASFGQTGQITSLRFTDVEYLTAFYPATGELLHGLGIVLLGRDTLSPGLNLVWLGLTLFAAYCVGRPRGLGPATLMGAAVVLATPVMRSLQAGSASNDIVGIFFLLAAVALVVNGRAAGSRAAIGLAAVAAGLAVSVKLSLLAPVIALSVGVVLTDLRIRSARPVWRGRLAARRTTATLWAAGLVLAGGFWYLRNLIAVGNPLPWVNIGIFATPAAPLQQHTGFSVAHYLANSRVWSRFFEPALASSFGPGWYLILAAAVLGPLACALRGPDSTVRMLGVVTLLSAAAYVVTPETAAGPAGHPIGFNFNLRYAAPAITLGLVTLPLAGPRRSGAVVGALAVVLAATFTKSSLWNSGYNVGGVLVGVSVGATLAAVLLLRPVVRRRRPARRQLALVLTGTVAVGACGAALGYLGQRHYLRGRYAYAGGSFAPVWAWFRNVHHARVAIVGTFIGSFSYPLYGLDDSNLVQYVGRHGPAGSFTPIASCAQWRTALGAGRYGYVVTTPGRNPFRSRPLLYSPEGGWTAGDPAARLVFGRRAFGQPISVYALHGTLHPGACRQTGRLASG